MRSSTSAPLHLLARVKNLVCATNNCIEEFEIFGKIVFTMSVAECRPQPLQQFHLLLGTVLKAPHCQFFVQAQVTSYAIVPNNHVLFHRSVASDDPL